MKFRIILNCLYTVVFIKTSECKEPFDNTVETKNIHYDLYTNKNPAIAQTINTGDVNSLNQSFFSKEADTKIVVHGWISNALGPVDTLTRDAYLSLYDVNIICVDWSEDAYGIYDEVVKVVPAVGKKVAEFLDWLIDNTGANVSSFHLIGFSLGAHVVGSAARNVKNGRITHITGLDPAKTHWKNSNERLDKSDGEYVEIIHTNIEGMGLEIPIGHNDFYPNGGQNMPGCIDDPCRHSRSYEYFADSIDHRGFMAEQCADLEEIINGNCSNQSQLHMGGSRPKKATGVFYLKTNAEKPFYQSEP